MLGCELYEIGSRQGPVVVACITVMSCQWQKEFIEQLIEYQVLSKDSSSRILSCVWSGAHTHGMWFWIVFMHLLPVCSLLNPLISYNLFGLLKRFLCIHKSYSSVVNVGPFIICYICWHTPFHITCTVLDILIIYYLIGVYYLNHSFGMM